MSIVKTRDSFPDLTLHKTRPIVEHLMFRRPDLHTPFRMLGVIDPADGRGWGPCEHRELAPMLRPINVNWLHIVSAVGKLQTVALINMEPKNMKNSKAFPVLFICGKYTTIESLSVEGMAAQIYQRLIFDDFLPDPFSRKVIYIKRWGDGGEGEDGWVEGACFSELYNRVWTMQDPRHVGLANRTKVGPALVVNNIILDIREDSLNAIKIEQYIDSCGG